MPSGGRSYWGVSHETADPRLLREGGRSGAVLDQPAEAMKSLQILKETYEVSGFLNGTGNLEEPAVQVLGHSHPGREPTLV